MATEVRSAKPARLACLDAFRGLDILIMIFVNYVAGMRLSPAWLQHVGNGVDGYTITDVVFPGFLFIVGVAIPLALHRRMMAGESPWKLAKHILSRTFALLFLGVLTVNEGSFDAAATGMSRALWFFLAFVAVIVFWNIYPKTEDAKKRRLYSGLRLAAAAALVILVVLFRGTTEAGAITPMQTSWWGILGLIGWSYMACCFVYLLTRGDRTALMGAMGFMLALYVGARHGALDFLGPAVNGFINIGSNFGSHAAIVTAGMLAGTLFVPGRDVPEPGRRMKFMAYLGLGTLIAGYVLRPLHGINKNAATESYALVTSGLCCLVLLGLLFPDGRQGDQEDGPTSSCRSASTPSWPTSCRTSCARSRSSSPRSSVSTSASFSGRSVRPAAWPGHINAIVMTLVILLIVRVLTKAKVILKL